MAVLNGKNDSDSISISSNENFSDSDSLLSDIEDDEECQLLLSEKPNVCDPAERSVVIYGAPVVDEAKVGKLKEYFQNKFSPFGELEGINIPLNESKMSYGFAVLAFTNSSPVKQAVKATNNLKMDKKHTLKVLSVHDVLEIMNVSDDFVPSQPEPFNFVGYLDEWLLDKRARSQFLYITAGTSRVCWMSQQQKIETVEQRENWTQHGFLWSPFGRYLATFHRQGVAIWAGPKFSKFQRFSHSDVVLADFSTDERHLVTYSIVRSSGGKPPVGQLTVFVVESGKIFRQFMAEALSPAACQAAIASMNGNCPPNPENLNPGGGSNAIWPLIRWSSNGRYFVLRRQDEALHIYDTEQQGLLDKQPLKIPGLQTYCWSPGATNNSHLAYWVAEESNAPARVVVLDIPSKVEVTKKNLFSVANLDMHWQSNGDYLAVVVQRYDKRKNTSSGKAAYIGLYSEMEIFALREKEVPIYQFNIKEPSLTAFAWEPNGHKLAYITMESPGSTMGQTVYQVQRLAEAQNVMEPPSMSSILQPDNSRSNLVILSIQGGKVERLCNDNEVAKHRYNYLTWSPKNPILLMASLGKNGGLEWREVHESKVTFTERIDSVTYSHVGWDGSGRYVGAWSTLKSDFDLVIYSSCGRVLNKFDGVEVKDLHYFSWRPYPPCQLDDAAIKSIKKKLKTYSAKFDMEDKLYAAAANAKFTETRKENKIKFNAWRKSLLAKREQLYEKLKLAAI